VYTHAVIIWSGILVLAIANGALRVDVLIPRFGEELGHVLSTIGLCVIILIVAWGAIAWIGPLTRGDSLRVGLLWLTMTLAFELLGGRYLFGTPWPQLLADYNVMAGRIWILVLLATLAAPALAAYARGLFAAR
jgi:hypothetical protein